MFNSLIEVEVIFLRKVYCAWSHCEIQRKGRGGLELGSRLSWRDVSVMGSSQPKSQEVMQKKS